MIRIEFDDDDLRRLRQAIEKAPEIVQDEMMRWGWDTGARLQEQVIQRTPVQSGALRNSIAAGLSVVPMGSIGVQQVGEFGVQPLPGQGIGVSVVIGSNEQYAPWVEFGTKPHKIRARNAKVLAFQGAGGTVFRREVNHPGTRGARMFGDAMDASEGAVRGSVRGLIDRIMKRVFGGAA